MVAKILLALFAASILAVPAAAAPSDKSKTGCVHKHKRVGAYGAKHVSPYYTPTASGVRGEYGAPYGQPVISSPYSPTRIVYRRRCAKAAG